MKTHFVNDDHKSCHEKFDLNNYGIIDAPITLTLFHLLSRN